MRYKNEQPVTLGDMIDQGLGVFGFCHSCSRNRVVPVAELVARLGRSMPVPAIGRRLKCQGCGSNDIHTRPHREPVATFAYPSC